MSTSITNAAATGFLKDVRHPLLALHREILDASRAQHESEFGPVSPGEFLQIVINGSAYRWIAPLSTLIAALDDVLDDAEATSDARIEMALAVSAMPSTFQCCRPVRRLPWRTARSCAGCKRWRRGFRAIGPLCYR